MAVYKIFPEKDATIYSLYPTLNTGMDEVLEVSLLVGSVVNPLPQTSRFLIKFPQEEINDLINTKISSSTWTTNLKCFVSSIEALSLDTILEVFPISGSWNMGTGKYLDLPIPTNGVSWVFRAYSGSQMWSTASFSTNVTASYSSSANAGGGTWYTASSAGLILQTQSFGAYTDKDLDLNVKGTIELWYSGTIANDGFIVKQKDEFVYNDNIQPKIKYFSRDTHTIYPPYLEFKWNDFIHSTGSSINTTLTSSNINVLLGENPNLFTSGSINKFRLYCRPTYPSRVFQTASLYTKNYYLPTASYYAVKDMYTNEYIIDFDDTYTKISADNISNYFTLYMNGLEPERYYKIIIKTIIDGNTKIIDDDYYFKVIN